MPKRMKRQSFIEGAMILSAATIIVKIIGAAFKIPLTNLLGGEGMGYFMTAYGLFNPIYALAVAGLPVAVSRLVAENAAQGRWRDCRRIRWVSTVLFLAAGLIGSLVMLFGAGTFVDFIGNEAALYPVMAMAPAVLFGCLTAAHRGYYQGLGNMTPTAVSQVVEAVVKLVAGYALAAFAMHRLSEGYRATGYVLNFLPDNAAQAERLILAFSAAGAVLGIALSTLAGTIYLFVHSRLLGDGMDRAMLSAAPRPRPGGEMLGALLRIALPVCIATVVTNLTSVIDLTTVLTRLDVAIKANPELFHERYAEVLASGIAASELPNFLHGSYQAIVITLFNIIPSLTATFGTSALPAVASAWAVGNKQALGRNIEAVVRITSLVAIPAGLGLAAMANPILDTLYHDRSLEIAAVAPLLRIMGVAAIFAALVTPIYACLQAVGRQDLPVKLVLLGAGLKFALNYLLTGIPEIGIAGAAISSIVSFAAIVVVALILLRKITDVRLRVVSAFLKPGFAGILCAGTAVVTHTWLISLLPGVIATFLSIGLGALCYLVGLLLVRGIAKEDVVMLPGGEKIAQTLEKYGLMG